MAHARDEARPKALRAFVLKRSYRYGVWNASEENEKGHFVVIINKSEAYTRRRADRKRAAEDGIVQVAERERPQRAGERDGGPRAPSLSRASIGTPTSRAFSKPSFYNATRTSYRESDPTLCDLFCELVRSSYGACILPLLAKCAGK